jgi:hypothetical protein
LGISALCGLSSISQGCQRMVDDLFPYQKW